MDKSWGKKKKLRNANELENVLRNESLGPGDLRSAEDRIQNLVILNAWRNERERNKGLRTEVKTLKSKVDGLQLQVYSLRQLLDSENARVVHFNCDLRKLLAALEELKNDKLALIKEKEHLESRIQTLEENLAGMENDWKNQKNELITARTEARTWEKQLEREREKVLRMKEERKFFVEEVRLKGNLLVWQIRSFEQFSRFFNFLQSKPNNPALPWDETSGRIEPELEMFLKTEKSPKRAQTALTVEKPLRGPEPKARRAKMAKRTAVEDVKIEELEKSILGKTEERSLVPYHVTDL